MITQTYKFKCDDCEKEELFEKNEVVIPWFKVWHIQDQNERQKIVCSEACLNRLMLSFDNEVKERYLKFEQEYKEKQLRNLKK